jgi:hypothetical protein
MSAECFNTIHLVTSRLISEYDNDKMYIYRNAIKSASEHHMAKLIPALLTEYPALSRSLVLPDKNNKKKNKLTIELITEILQFYIKQTILPKGGGEVNTDAPAAVEDNAATVADVKDTEGAIDIKQILNVIIGCIMQNDTIYTFNLENFLDELIPSKATMSKIISHPIQVPYSPPLVAAYGGRRIQKYKNTKKIKRMQQNRRTRSRRHTTYS